MDLMCGRSHQILSVYAVCQSSLDKSVNNTVMHLLDVMLFMSLVQRSSYHQYKKMHLVLSQCCSRLMTRKLRFRSFATPPLITMTRPWNICQQCWIMHLLGDLMCSCLRRNSLKYLGLVPILLTLQQFDRYLSTILDYTPTGRDSTHEPDPV